MRTSGRTTLASLATMAAIMSGVGHIGVDRAQPGSERALGMFGGYRSGSRGTQRRAGPGWSNRHVKRHRARSRA